MCLIKKNDSSRVMVFVDVRNVIGGLRKTTGRDQDRVDFVGLAEELVGKRELVAAYAFDGIPSPQNADTVAPFHKHLEKEGYRLRLRGSFETETRAQKQVDMAMGIEMVLQAKQNSFDVAIVVTGDSDFVPAVEAMQGFGKTVEVASFDANCGAPLKRSADMYTSLDKLPVVIVDSKSLLRESDDEPEEEDGFVELTPDGIQEGA